MESVQVMHELQRADRTVRKSAKAEPRRLSGGRRGIVVRARESIGSTYERAGQAASRPGQGAFGLRDRAPALASGFWVLSPLASRSEGETRIKTSKGMADQGLEENRAI
jgi:hypothetical protein